MTSSTNFSARWTGFVKPAYSQNYTFYSNTTKGARLWIDNKLVIDKWTNASQTEYSSTTVSMEAGKLYTVKMEVGGGTATLSWSSSSQSKQVIPTGSLFPSFIETYAEGIDLLEGLHGRTVLANSMYGWSRNSTSEDSTGNEQFWRVTTGSKSYIEEKPDLRIRFRRTSGQYDVKRDLGNAGSGYTTWRVSGHINYEGNYAMWDDEQEGTFFDILDDQGKVITRLTHEQYVNGNEMNKQLNFNGQTLLDLPEKDIYAALTKNQAFEINGSSAGMSIKFGPYSATNAAIVDGASHWNKPTTQVSFYRQHHYIRPHD